MRVIVENKGKKPNPNYVPPATVKTKEKAVCYAVYGWWRYYRTASGETFSIRDGKDYFYYGNVKNGENTDVKYLNENEVEAIKKRIDFVG